MSAQRYGSPVARKRMANYLCPECGFPPAAHSGDMRFWMPRRCALTRVGVEERIEQWCADVDGEVTP